MVNIRDYEVSIWTLQDSFIAILKQSNLENMEKIQEPKMVLKDDGDNSFSFKIPMYLKRDTDLTEKPYFKDESVFVENPIWYTVRNGNLISSLRKIKVIFNKHSSDEEVFEFIINDIKETHEGKSKICEVECGGLAFHELGKQGYDIVLSGKEYDADYKEWFDSDRTKPEPINNIDYWIKKVLVNSNWNYVINMDWSLYDGIIDGNRSSNVRQANKVYREPYISSWTIDENANKLFAANSVTNLDELEKRAIVEGAESNRYNLLQSIAEAFQVFCKFKYLYDDNYHIIGRQVVFYNNFIKEAEEIVDFNYGYNTSQIVREMDGTDLVTKMYVKPLSNSGTFAGEIGLRDTEANPSLENYLLNFNYLYKIGTISQEQYDEIDGFQKELRKLNLEYEEETLKLQDCINKIPIEEAIVKTSEDIIEQAGERVKEASAAIGALVNENGLIGFSQQNPHHFVVIHDTSSSRYYINIGREYQSFVPSSFYLYAAINAEGAVSGSPITGLKFEKDSNGLITKVTFPNTQLSNDSTSVYAVFQYNPYTPNKIIKNIWASKQKQAEKDKENAGSRLNNLNSLKETYEKNIQTILNNKQNCINRFERIMGPALREGTWQPEDEYVNYKKDSVFSLGNGNNSLISVNNATDGVAHFSWEPSWGNRMEEQTLDYAYGANETRYYPCIDLRKVSLSSLTEEQLSNLNLVYRDPYLGAYTDTYPEGDPRVNHYLQVGADNGCKFMFIKPKNGTEIIPVLMVLGMTALTTTTTGISPEAQIQASARLSVISYSGENILENKKVSVDSSEYWVTNLQNYEVVYPKFSISIDRYISTTPENKIYYNNSPLEEYKDYYAPIFHENKYWITIKPEVAYLKPSAIYKFYYSTTTAPEAIYLDAVEILRENSVPKVSYTISPLAINQNFIKNAYNRLGQLAHINDQELKFENVQGYISEVDLDLDKPWEDSYIIKNYKTKFEDLFSTIVAQTEAMKKNSQLFGMVSNAFNSNGLLENAIVDDIKNRLDIYIPTSAEIYSQYEPQIRAELQQAFNEAGEVLVAAQNSVNDVNNLNLTNSRILGSFVENIKENMTPNTFVNYPRESENFKVGDVWRFTQNNISYEYLATENSSQVNYNGETLSKTRSLRGWSLTKDGSLAQIKGTSFDLDSENGIIQFEAETIIKAKSGGDIALQANNNILIQANNTVDINGAQINLNSLSSTNPPRGILIQAVNNYNNKTASSKIDIKSSGIEMMTAGGISMAGAGGINIYTSNNAFSGTSAISINKTTGIYIGSGKSIILYSGEVPADASNSNYSSKGASVLINKDRILFGVSDTTTTGTAIDLTKNRIVIGAGADINGNNIENIGSSATGIKITKEAIDFAAGNNNLRSYLHLAKDQILISNTSSSSTGAQVSISQSGIIIGTVSKATNSNKTGFVDKIQSGVQATDSSTATFQVYAPNFVVDEGGHLYAYDATINGNITANTGYIGGSSGWTIQSNRIYSSSFGNLNGGWPSSGNGIILHTNSTYAELDLYSSGNITAQLTAGADVDRLFYIGDSNSNIAFWKTNGLSVLGEINATSGSIAGWTIGNGYITTNSNRTSYNASSEGMTMTVKGIGAYKSTTSNGVTTVKSFSLSADEGLVAQGANISGYINATGGNFTGTINAGSGTIGGISLNSEYGLYTNGKTSSTSTNSGFLISKNGAIYLGPYDTDSGTCPFQVTLTGEMTATKGTIGGWMIGKTWIGSKSTTTSQLRGDSQVGISVTGGDAYCAFWAGGSPNENNHNRLDPDNTAFYVTKSGELVARKAKILGDVEINTQNKGIYISARNGLSVLKLKTDLNSATENWDDNGTFYVGVSGSGETVTRSYLKMDDYKIIMRSESGGILKIDDVSGVTLRSTAATSILLKADSSSDSHIFLEGNDCQIRNPYILIRGNTGTRKELYRLVVASTAPNSSQALNNTINKYSSQTDFPVAGVIYIKIPASGAADAFEECKVYYASLSVG